MNEKVRNNKFFTSPKSFRDAIEEFFERTWSRITPFFKNRINDHFQTIKPVSSG
ncbi:hypothetical protein [Candidatus Williamhamiltonella defendens]|uniref:hypothetical protein n=1 Tax=Candidatus Williamhamiltonella defendens TaxID=138072 RepID=UPI00387E633D